MELVLEKIIRGGALCVAVSPDESRVAISSERRVVVLSLPDYQKIVVFSVWNPASMLFLADNRSILILNTTGRPFLWNGEVLEKLDHWQMCETVTSPLFYSGDRYAFLAEKRSVWRYDIGQRKLAEIYSSDKYPVICSFDNGRLTLLSYDDQFYQQNIEIITLDIDGCILDRKLTKEVLPTFGLWRACCPRDGVIAYCAINGPRNEVGESQKRSLVWIDGSSGKVLSRIDNGDRITTGYCYGGNGLVAESFWSGSRGVDFYNTAKAELIKTMDREQLDPNRTLNPSTAVQFLSDGHILVGSLRRLYVLFASVDQSVDSK